MGTSLTNRFLAIFDIIGFKNLIEEKGTEEVFQYLNRNVLLAVQYAATDEFIFKEQNKKQVSVPDLSKANIKYQIFSNTIIFYTKDDSFISYIFIVKAAIRLMTLSFVGQAPYRGAIGYGDFMENEISIMVGTSIIDAYKGEQSQVWSGCMLTKGCEDFCKKMNYFEMYTNVFQQKIENSNNEDEITSIKEWDTAVIVYDVPIKKRLPSGIVEYNSESHYVINWTHWVGKGRKIEESFQTSDNDHHKRIKMNTLEFEKWARRRSL